MRSLSTTAKRTPSLLVNGSNQNAPRTLDFLAGGPYAARINARSRAVITPVCSARRTQALTFPSRARLNGSSMATSSKQVSRISIEVFGRKIWFSVTPGHEKVLRNRASIETQIVLRPRLPTLPRDRQTRHSGFRTGCLAHFGRHTSRSQAGRVSAQAHRKRRTLGATDATRNTWSRVRAAQASAQVAQRLAYRTIRRSCETAYGLSRGRFDAPSAEHERSRH